MTVRSPSVRAGTESGAGADAQPILSVRGLSKAFGATRAIDDLSVDIGRGELVSFVGPSGCGKTTLLRTIAGFVRQDAGTIRLDGQVIDQLPPERRPTGMVFQAYALFPHLSVFDNVAYGLAVHGVPKSERAGRVREVLETVRLTGREDRKPRELSGGQQQRVALARCLVLRPKVLLLDEPLSNLDANLRIAMRDEIRRLKDTLDLTVVFVTHDQEEALSISDRLLVLADGRVQQLGTPPEIYGRPANRFVATFMGEANVIRGTLRTDDRGTVLSADGFAFPVSLEGVPGGTTVQVLVRPEMLRISDDGPVEGRVLRRAYHGRSTRYEVDAAGQTLKVDERESAPTHDVGDPVRLALPARLHVLPDEGPPPGATAP